MSTQRIKFGLAFLLVLTLMVGLTGSATAADFRGDDTITIGKDEVIDDDLFVSGNRAMINGTVTGNLFVVAGDVQVNGPVNGSVFAVGQTVTINSAVDGSVYVGAMSLTLGQQAAIGRNALVGLYSLTAQPGSTIKRDLYAGGYQAVLDGAVGRDVGFGGAALELNGHVGRNVKAGVAEPGTARGPMFTGLGAQTPPAIAPGIRVGRAARIDGKLEYTSSVDQSSAILATPEGGVVLTYRPSENVQARPTPPSPLAVWGGAVLAGLREFATLFVLGLLALAIVPQVSNLLIARAQERPLPAVGWGLVALIGGFVLAFLVAVVVVLLAIFLGVITLGGLASTVLGLGFAALAFAFSIFMLLVSYGAKLVIAYLVGRLILAQFHYADHRIWALVVGVLVMVLATSIPILGGLIGLGATLVGLGAMWIVLRERRGGPPQISAPIPAN